MSEILPRENQELYRELGLEELAAPEYLEEDPTLHEDNHLSLRTLEGFTSFFDKKDFPGSPAQGYGALAANLSKQLRRLSEAIDSNLKERTIIPLRLRPEAPINIELFNSLTDQQQHNYLKVLHEDPFKLYEFEETTASRAFRGALDTLLHPQEPPGAVRGEERPDKSFYSGRYFDPAKDKDINLTIVETFSQDELGRYRALELRSPIDVEDLRPRIRSVESRSFTPPEAQRVLQEAAHAVLMAEWDNVLDEAKNEAGGVKGTAELIQKKARERGLAA